MVVAPLCLQNVTLLPFGGAGLKVFHLSIAAFGLYWLYGLTFNINLSPPLMFIGLLVIISLLVGTVYGISLLFINYIFIFMLGLVIAAHPEPFSFAVFRQSLFIIAIPVFVYVILNIVFNLEAVIVAQAFNIKFGGRPIIPNMLFSGGWNIEATYLAMLSVLFIRSRWFIFFISITLLVSIAYLSRTGLVLSLVLMVFWVFFALYDRVSTFTLFFFIPVLLLSLFILFLIVGFYLDISVVKRLFIIGSEPGSQGRLNILQYVIPGLLDSMFFGYGPGNSMDKLIAMGLETNNNNLHNYYLQVLLDFGLLGLIAYVLFICYFLFNPHIVLEFKLFLSLYLLASFVQFRGAEPLIWSILFFAFLVNSQKSNTSPSCQSAVIG
ncbi:MAG: putative inorganic carbon (HCO3(-)) transporter [Paraglaciecola sp.]